MANQVEISRELALEMYRRMVLIRQFEDRLYQLFLQGLVPGTLHQYQGQEAIAVGVCCALRNEDMIFSTHRPVGHAIAKGVDLGSIGAEIWGKATGCAGGKGGQMHLGDRSVGMPPSNAIVGANIPIATGAAIGFMLRGSDQVAVSFFGDGASNSGAFHEGINLAAVKKAAVIFVCENNEYAASTHVSKNLNIENIAERASAYGIPGSTLDGMDVHTVYRSAGEAIDRARRGHGPTLLEYKTYRFMGHSRGDPGGYRRREEVTAHKEQDPIAKQRKGLAADFRCEEEELTSIEERCRREVEEAIEFALSSAEPEEEELSKHVFAD